MRLKIVGMLGVLLLLTTTACSTMYPKMLDDPAVIKAMADCIKASNKTWSADGSISNPEFECYYKMSVGARVIGVDGSLRAAGASGPTE